MLQAEVSHCCVCQYCCHSAPVQFVIFAFVVTMLVGNTPALQWMGLTVALSKSEQLKRGNPQLARTRAPAAIGILCTPDLTKPNPGFRLWRECPLLQQCGLDGTDFMLRSMESTSPLFSTAK